MNAAEIKANRPSIPLRNRAIFVGAVLFCILDWFIGTNWLYYGPEDDIYNSVKSWSAMWCGVVIAISFMEAWVKFKAPMLVKPVAVDVGRHVFWGLHRLEIILMIIISFTYMRLSRESFWQNYVTHNTVYLDLTAIILAVEIFWLQPELDNHAIEIIKQYQGKMKDSPYTTILTQKRKHHSLFIATEILKVTMLLFTIFK